MIDNGGFTIDGIPALELKIIMTKDSDRPIAPATVDRFLSIPGRNGLLDFGADVGARYFNLDCRVITRNYLELQEVIERIASALLDGYGRPKTVKIVLDSRPDRYYLVRYSGSLSIDRLFGLGSFILPLVAVDPYARSLTSSDSVILDSDILLDSDIRLDDDWSYQVAGNAVFEVNNWGTMIVKPTIVVSGKFSNLHITANGKTFDYNVQINNETLTINSERLTVKKGGTNALSGMSGNFIELIAGINNISITGTSLIADVSFDFETRYF